VKVEQIEQGGTRLEDDPLGAPEDGEATSK
jgi:hypothetical protein